MTVKQETLFLVFPLEWQYQWNIICWTQNHAPNITSKLSELFICSAVQNKDVWFPVFHFKARVRSLCNRSQSVVIITHASATCGCAEQLGLVQWSDMQLMDLHHADGQPEEGVSQGDSSFTVLQCSRGQAVLDIRGTPVVSCNYMLRRFNVEYVWPVHHSADGQDSDQTGCWFGTTARMANSPSLTEGTQIPPHVTSLTSQQVESKNK